MRKLLVASLILFAAPALATPSFSVSAPQCTLGYHCAVKVTKIGAATSYSDIAVSTSGSVQAIQTTVRFLKADTVKLVYAQSLSAGPFTATIKRVRYALIGQGTAAGTVVDPNAPPPPPAPPPPLPPPPAPAPGTTVALFDCPAINNGDLLVVGQSYTIVGTAGYSQPGDPPTSAKDILILNDATHRGDGWFGLYVPAGCVTAG